jgi:hypothetical protein
MNTLKAWKHLPKSALKYIQLLLDQNDDLEQRLCASVKCLDARDILIEDLKKQIDNANLSINMG